MGIKFYNGDDIVVVFGHIIIHSSANKGKGTDEFLSIEDETDAIEDECGVDSEVTVSPQNDYRANVVLTLRDMADVNDQLSVVYTLGRTAPKMAGGILPLRISHIQGRFKASSKDAYIKKGPPVTFKRAPGERVWTLRATHMNIHYGGS
jgi:hypothetical protein